MESEGRWRQISGLTNRNHIRLRLRIRLRFADYGLELNEEKTGIVYCKDDDRKGNHKHTSFDFLGYTFRPRHAKNKYGKFFTNFLPAMGEKAKKSEIYDVLRYINGCLVKWVRRKFKKRRARRRAEYWLGEVAKRDKNMFAHWKFGILPSAG